MEKKEKKKSRNAYISEWDKKNRIAVTIRLRRDKDSELIEVYQKIPNKAEWLRECLTAEQKKMKSYSRQKAA